MTLLVAMLLAQPFNLNQQPIDVRDEGVRQSPWRSWAANCTGAGITCTVDGGVWQLAVSGGGGGGTTPTVSCLADQALNWNGTVWSCTSKVREAYMADAGTYALVSAAAYSADASTYATIAQTAYSADASVFATIATTANVAYSADASVFAAVATVAAAAYSADAATFATVATTANVAYSADASVYAAVLTLTCGAGQYVTCNGTTCTCGTPAGTGVTSVTGSTFVASSGGTTPAISLNATGTPSATTFLRGDNTWATPPGGGGGGGNYVSDTITFAGKSDALRTVTAAWATTSSVILCNAASEESSVERLLLSITTRSAGSFVVRGSVSQGTHTGALSFHCTGL